MRIGAIEYKAAYHCTEQCPSSIECFNFSFRRSACANIDISSSSCSLTNCKRTNYGFIFFNRTLDVGMIPLIFSPIIDQFHLTPWQIAALNRACVLHLHHHGNKCIQEGHSVIFGQELQRIGTFLPPFICIRLLSSFFMMSFHLIKPMRTLKFIFYPPYTR